MIREVEFLRPLSVGILSERRSCRPFGLMGGEPGEPGVNFWIRREDGRTINIGGKAQLAVSGGEPAALEERSCFVRGHQDADPAALRRGSSPYLYARWGWLRRARGRGNCLPLPNEESSIAIGRLDTPDPVRPHRRGL